MNTEHVKIKVWDLPTRIFHWGMVCLLALLWWSADAGEMQWHQIFAYSLLILIGFRILWGLIGSDTARFSHFVHHPKVVLDYLRSIRTKGMSVVLGHNPIGGYMVIALIGIISLQLVTGLFATDDIFTEGPLYSYVSSDTSGFLTWLHKTNFNFILLLSAIHILAVIIHAMKGDKLVGAMISGYKKVSKVAFSSSAKSELRFKSEWLALVLFTVCAAVVFGYLMWPIVQVL
ncbi:MULTISPECIES: cytochrome b/b6 domain-containing protein [unclassified Shewanella]|uniref:cytochrome b/b6 domain-containing protein n=1 Tax=Shewanella TaxID=22 RepID=UPI001B574EEB|nr:MULTISPECIES: cytochrome b/b6 domain-containing protein [unclassified Shewanella]MBP6517465.1 cytochrome b/b6 domain-containing protein [Shewanella sp.]MCU8015702.1 cytochrome b/b6 domain-containing protein [Shewanella sp. SM72]MCU8071092.1 cytochrome b/b6 domain-containing protein [Shewanella sp. SM32]